MEYNKFPHIFNKIVGYIIDTKEVEEIKEYMERIKRYNIEVYVGIVRERIELHQIRKLDTESQTLLTTQSAIFGYAELLRYLHEKEYKWDKYTCAYAAKRGQIECLRYLHEKGCKWNWETCKYAASNGQIECLRYAHENGCEWDNRKCAWHRVTCVFAAMYGQIECLKYAHENGCEWDKETYEWAIRNGQMECLKYAHKNGCEYDKVELLEICDEMCDKICREYIEKEM